MMSWMAERDRLLAQTRAFVKEVAAAHPKPAPYILPDPLPAGPPRSDAGVVTFASVNAPPTAPKTLEAFKIPEASKIAEASKITEALKIAEALPSPTPQARPVSHDMIATESNVPTGWASIGGGGESDRALSNTLDVTRREVKVQSSDAVLIIPRVASSERDDIAIRVAHFREHQRRLNREREAYSEQMRARIRSVIGNGGSAA